MHFLKQNQTPCSLLMEKALFFANWAHQSQSTTHTWNFQFLPVELLGEVATRHVYGQMEALVGWGGATWLFCSCCEMAGEPTHMCYALWQMVSQFKTPFSNTAFWDSRAQRRVLINFVNNDFYHSFSIGYCMTKRITHVHTFGQRTNEASSCNFNFCYISIILNSLIRDKIIIFPIVLFCWIAYSSITAKKISLFN